MEQEGPRCKECKSPVGSRLGFHNGTRNWWCRNTFCEYHEVTTEWTSGTPSWVLAHTDGSTWDEYMGSL